MISSCVKRAVLCVPNPYDYIDQFNDYSIMIINPSAPDSRKQYLLDQADWSIKITAGGIEYQQGKDYGDERLFWYTSGTTGDSKFYSFTQAQVDQMSKIICQAYDITHNDRYVGIMPLWHAHGQGFYWATKHAKCERYFLPVQNLRNIADHRPTFLTAVPDLLKTIGQFDLKNLRFIRSASAPMPDNLYKDLAEKFRVPVIEAFGMTESLSHCFTNPLHGEQRMGTVGLPDGIQADIQNSQLLIKGPCLFNNNQWFNTGDLAEQDEKGYFKILGRSKDRINIKGYKLDPDSIERQLLRMIPDLKEVAIFGINSINCVFVGDCDKNIVFQTLIKIHSGCRPSYIEQVDSIPRGDSEKLSRSWLIKHYNSR